MNIYLFFFLKNSFITFETRPVKIDLIDSLVLLNTLECVGKHFLKLSVDLNKIDSSESANFYFSFHKYFIYIALIL